MNFFDHFFLLQCSLEVERNCTYLEETFSSTVDLLNCNYGALEALGASVGSRDLWLPYFLFFLNAQINERKHYIRFENVVAVN